MKRAIFLTLISLITISSYSQGKFLDVKCYDCEVIDLSEGKKYQETLFTGIRIGADMIHYPFDNLVLTNSAVVVNDKRYSYDKLFDVYTKQDFINKIQCLKSSQNIANTPVSCEGIADFDCLQDTFYAVQLETDTTLGIQWTNVTSSGDTSTGEFVVPKQDTCYDYFECITWQINYKAFDNEPSPAYVWYNPMSVEVVEMGEAIDTIHFPAFTNGNREQIEAWKDSLLIIYPKSKIEVRRFPDAENDIPPPPPNTDFENINAMYLNQTYCNNNTTFDYLRLIEYNGQSYDVILNNDNHYGEPMQGYIKLDYCTGDTLGLFYADKTPIAPENYPPCFDICGSQSLTASCDKVDTIIYGAIDTFKNTIQATHYDYDLECTEYVTQHTSPANLSLAQSIRDTSITTATCDTVINLSSLAEICPSGQVLYSIVSQHSTGLKVGFFDQFTGDMHLFSCDCQDGTYDFEVSINSLNGVCEPDTASIQVQINGSGTVSVPPSAESMRVTQVFNYAAGVINSSTICVENPSTNDRALSSFNLNYNLALNDNCLTYSGSDPDTLTSNVGQAIYNGGVLSWNNYESLAVGSSECITVDYEYDPNCSNTEHTITSLGIDEFGNNYTDTTNVSIDVCQVCAVSTEQPCDDGDPNTINDVEQVDPCGNVCQPCAGELGGGDCTLEQPCDDGDANTENDVEYLNTATLQVCIPCAGTPLAVNASATGIVWVDLNVDGIKSGEAGLNSATVSAYRNNNGTYQLYDTDITGGNDADGTAGVWTINLPAGQYYFEMSSPLPYQSTLVNQGTNELIDNDMTEANGTRTTGVYTIAPNENITGVGFGFDPNL